MSETISQRRIVELCKKKAIHIRTVGYRGIITILGALLLFLDFYRVAWNEDAV